MVIDPERWAEVEVDGFYKQLERDALMWEHRCGACGQLFKVHPNEKCDFYCDPVYKDGNLTGWHGWKIEGK